MDLEVQKLKCFLPLFLHKYFYIEIYKWRKVSKSADVFVWVFTSAYNRDVAAELCNKIWTLSPPPPIFPSLPTPSALALFGKWKLHR
jgi:hypothetical protein